MHSGCTEREGILIQGEEIKERERFAQKKKRETQKKREAIAEERHFVHSGCTKQEGIPIQGEIKERRAENKNR